MRNPVFLKDVASVSVDEIEFPGRPTGTASQEAPPVLATESKVKDDTDPEAESNPQPKKQVIGIYPQHTELSIDRWNFLGANCQHAPNVPLRHRICSSFSSRLCVDVHSLLSRIMCI